MDSTQTIPPSIPIHSSKLNNASLVCPENLDQRKKLAYPELFGSKPSGAKRACRHPELLGDLRFCNRVRVGAKDLAKSCTSASGFLLASSVCENSPRDRGILHTGLRIKLS
jgi:hypothetical protein